MKMSRRRPLGGPRAGGSRREPDAHGEPLALQGFQRRSKIPGWCPPSGGRSLEGAGPTVPAWPTRHAGVISEKAKTWYMQNLEVRDIRKAGPRQVFFCAPTLGFPSSFLKQEAMGREGVVPHSSGDLTPNAEPGPWLKGQSFRPAPRLTHW